MNWNADMLSLFDLNYTWRLIRKKAGFNALCVVVIALGLCVSVVDYYFVSILAYKNLDFPRGERISLLKVARDSTNLVPVDSGWDGFRFRFLQDNSSSFEELGAMDINAIGVLSDGEVSERISTAKITPNLLGITDVQPSLGRGLTNGDALLGASRVAVISHDLWQSYYNGRTDVVGHAALVNGELTTIVGVFPEGFAFPYSHDLWLPLQLPVESVPEETSNVMLAGLLAEGVSRDQASDDTQRVLAQLTTQFPEIYQDFPVAVTPYVQLNNSGIEPITQTMLAAMLIIILLSCVNVANLIWVRTSERYHELLIQCAIGATRWHLVRQVLLESLLVCALGGVVGIALIFGVMELFKVVLIAFRLSNTPFWIQPGLDAQLIFIALAVLGFIWLVAGGIPAWKISRLDKGEIISGGSKGIASTAGNTVNDGLVGFELVTSIFLLIVSGALVIGIQQASRTDFGADPVNLHSANLALPAAEYPDAESRLGFVDALRAELEALPMIESATYATAIPARSGTFTPYLLEGQDRVDERDTPRQFVVSVADNYLQTLGVELLAGRFFDGGDTASSLPVVIVDQLFADSLVNGSIVQDRASLIGRRLLIDPRQNDEWVTIVGITSHLVQTQPLGGRDLLTSLYRPYSQRSIATASMVVKTMNESFLPMEDMKVAAAAIDRNIPLYSFESFADTFFDSMVGLTMTAYMFIAMSAVTLLLAASGVYAIISRSVLQRTHETGVRRSLGSSDRQAIMRFVRKGVNYLAGAILLGGMGAVLVTQGFAAFLPQIMSFLPLTIVSVIVMFSLVILGSSYLPARRIVALDPGDALHYY